MEAYLAIQELDSVHAATRNVTPSSRLQRVLLDGRWADALVSADALGDADLRVACLQHLGCHSLAALCAVGGDAAHQGPGGEPAMEAAWRMGQWGDLGQALPPPHTVASSSGMP